MKDEIIQFLKENIIGKTLLTGAVYKLENGNLEGVYNDKMTFGKSSVSCPLKPSDSAPLKHSTMPP